MKTRKAKITRHTNHLTQFFLILNFNNMKNEYLMDGNDLGRLIEI